MAESSGGRQVGVNAALLVFLVAFVGRLAVVPLSLLRVNPYSQADAVGFANAAELAATRLAVAKNPFNLDGWSTTYEFWGGVLSPFWLLPGPSELYAHLFVALLGAVTVYNIWALGTAVHSQRAGVYAALPFLVMPSILLTQGTLLREAGVLAGATTAARYTFASPPSLRIGYRIAFVLWSAAFLVFLRPETAPIILVAAGVGCVVWLGQHRSRLAGRVTVFSAAGATVVALLALERAVGYIEYIRTRRAEGRTAYHGFVEFSGAVDLIAYSWVGAAYLLFAPFPWMVGTIADVVAMLEGVVVFVMFVLAVWSSRILYNRRPVATAVMGTAVLAGTVMFGFGTVNVGTAVRHRPMFLWILSVFAGVGIAEKAVVRW